jgi:hypothetical protein
VLGHLTQLGVTAQNILVAQAGDKPGWRGAKTNPNPTEQVAQPGMAAGDPDIHRMNLNL